MLRRLMMAGGGAAPAGDPLWANVLKLTHFDGTGPVAPLSAIPGGGSDSNNWACSITGSFEYVTGLYGNALRLNGGLISYSTTAVATPRDSLLGNMASCFEFAVKFDSLANAPHLLTIGSAEERRLSVWCLGGKLRLFYKVTPTYYYDLYIHPTSLEVGRFYRIALQVRGRGHPQQGIDLFLDGTRIYSGSTAALVAFSNIYDPMYFVFGHQNWGGLAGDRFYGLVDEIRLTIGAERYSGNYTPTGPFPDGP